MSDQTQDYIDTLTLQRNAALDEIARMSVIIRSLQRQIATPTTDQHNLDLAAPQGQDQG